MQKDLRDTLTERILASLDQQTQVHNPKETIMTKFDIYRSAIKTGSVWADSLQAAAVAAQLTRATVCDDVAFQWFLDGDQSFAVEVIPA